jgi:hypothetical protein
MIIAYTHAGKTIVPVVGRQATDYKLPMSMLPVCEGNDRVPGTEGYDILIYGRRFGQ